MDDQNSIWLQVADPKAAPVWEIIGAEFSASNSHSADGISIRFPRVTKIRDDKVRHSDTACFLFG